MTAINNLFSKKLGFSVKNSDRDDERRSSIKVDLDLETVTNPLHRKELIVRLTDDSDLFFLYTLALGEEDFQSLKAQQGLLVDFSSFPQKLIELFNLCHSEEDKASPKFILQFVSSSISISSNSTAQLNIVETNPFKHLTHLSLKLLPGSDTDVKKYLAGCLKSLKDEKSHLEETLKNTENELQQRLKHTQEILSTRSTELDNLKTEWNVKTQDLSTNHAREINSEKEKSLQVQSNYQQKYDRERRELEQAHMKIVKQMESRLYELDTSNKDLTDRKYKNESSIREMKSKLSIFEDENHNIKQEVQSLRKANNHLDNAVHEQEKQINQLKTKTAVLEQELRDKEQVLTKSSDLLGAEQEQKKKYEEEIDQKQRQITKLETSIKSMAEDLIKGNQIIKKLQGEIRTYHSKLKLRNKITTEQENSIQGKEEDLEKSKKEINEVKTTLSGREEENRKLNEKLESTLQKLEESKQLLKTNENVINWLNKQVTDNQLSRHTGTFEMPSHSASYKSVGLQQSSSQVHNFSTPGSVQSYNTGVHQNPGMGATRFTANSSLQQVQYRPVPARQSSLPVPVHKSTPIPPIPEEISPTPHRARADKENDPPLDPKYFQSGQHPVRQGGNRSMSPVPIQIGPPTGQGQINTRLSQQSVVAKVNTKSVPLASAYFPDKLKSGS